MHTKVCIGKYLFDQTNLVLDCIEGKKSIIEATGYESLSDVSMQDFDKQRERLRNMKGRKG